MTPFQKIVRAERLDQDYRGTGRTTRALLAAPKGAGYVWCSPDLDYVRAILLRIERPDIVVYSRADLRPNYLWHRRPLPHLVLDHATLAVITDMEWNEYIAIDRLRLFYERSNKMKNSEYVCPQCGPDPRGSVVHGETMHTWPVPAPVTAAAPSAEASPGIDPMQNPFRPAYYLGTAADETPAEDVLRKLACWLGAGGYNAPKVDAKVFHEKIVWGIEEAIKTAVALAARGAATQGEPDVKWKNSDLDTTWGGPTSYPGEHK